MAFDMPKWPRTLKWGLNRDARLGLLLALPVILIMGGLVLFRLLSSLVQSFFRVEPMKPGMPFVGLKNYIKLMGDQTVLGIWATTGSMSC